MTLNELFKFREEISADSFFWQDDMMLNKQTLEPLKKELLLCDEEELQDDPTFEQQILANVSHAMQNIEDYKPKGERKIMIRACSK